MKKLIALISLVFVAFTSFAQFQSTEIQVNSSPTTTIRIETYDSSFCYFHDEYDSTITVLVPDLSGGVSPINKRPHSMTQKYSNWTPGQLFEKAGKLKNNALTIGLVSGAISGTIIGCSVLVNDPLPMYITGAAIGFVGGLSALIMNYTANRLVQEAGLKMQKIQFTGNSVTVRF